MTAWPLNLRAGVTEIARDAVWLHWIMLTICVVIFVLVFGVMFYSLWAHRKSRGHEPAQFHESLGVEIAWTLIPFFIIIAIGGLATRTVIAMKDTTEADLTIKVTGYQWRWGYEYLDGPAAGLKYLSVLATPRAQIENQEPKSDLYLLQVDRPLVVPVDKKVRVLLTASDVIHAWFMPDFGVKQDAIPGFLRDTWFRADTPGTYRGQCAELCGKDHAFMPIVVEVKSQADYDAWAAEQRKIMAAEADDPNKTWTEAELMERGAKVFGGICVACHQANGRGIPGSFPALDGNPIVLGPEGPQVETVLKGRPGTAMAAFGTQLNDVEIAAVITYTRHAWSNAGKGADPVVQPKDVKAAR